MAKKKNREQQDARTVDEILDELRNSALHVPIVIVEGRDDVKFYREIAYHQLAASQIAFDFVGNRIGEVLWASAVGGPQINK
jgi:hypothetical protein